MGHWHCRVRVQRSVAATKYLPARCLLILPEPFGACLICVGFFLGFGMSRIARVVESVMR